MLIKNLVDTDGKPFDLRFSRHIQERGFPLAPSPNEPVHDAGGRCAVPGLHDHHCHFLAYAAALGSVDCAASDLEQPSALKHFLGEQAAYYPDGLRAIGYHEGAHALIDRHFLNSVSASLPIRVQHRTGRLWIYNDAAIAQLRSNEFPDAAERDEEGKLTGRFFHMDDWLRQHFPKPLPDIARASLQLAAYGITGLTDAGPDNDAETVALFRAFQENDRLLQRVTLMGRPDLDFTSTDSLMLGPCKIYLKESALPEFDELCALIARQHQRRRAVAFHCVTEAELHFALAALTEVGSLPSDRIEHASLCDDEALKIIRQLDISVVSQPIFIAERGDRYRASLSEEEQRILYRARSFLDAAIPFAASSDAPFGNANPWLCMRAAVARATPSGVILNPHEALSPQAALSMYLGKAEDPGRQWRSLTPGNPADLVILESAAITLDTPPRVSKTFINGRCVYDGSAPA